MIKLRLSKERNFNLDNYHIYIIVTQLVYQVVKGGNIKSWKNIKSRYNFYDVLIYKIPKFTSLNLFLNCIYLYFFFNVDNQ